MKASLSLSPSLFLLVAFFDFSLSACSVRRAGCWIWKHDPLSQKKFIARLESVLLVSLGGFVRGSSLKKGRNFTPVVKYRYKIYRNRADSRDMASVLVDTSLDTGSSSRDVQMSIRKPSECHPSNTRESLMLQDIGLPLQSPTNDTSYENAIAEEDEEERELVAHWEPEKAGWRAWSVVFGSFMGATGNFGMINSVGAIQSYIGTHQLKDTSTSTTGWIFSIFLGMCYVLCIFSGDLFDRLGPRIPNVIGTLLQFAGLIATANCTTVYQFILAYGILTALGSALSTCAIIGVVPDWFPRNQRGLALSIATLGSSVGGIAFPSMLSKLYTSVGFEWAIRIFAFICLACLTTATILNVGNPDKPKIVRVRRQSIVSTPDNRITVSSIRKGVIIYLSGMFDFSCLTDLPFLFLTIAVTFAEVSLFSGTTYLPSYAVAQGISSQSSLTLLTVSNAAGMVGRLIQGFVSDRLGPFNTALVSYTFVTVIVFILWLGFGYSERTLFGFAALYGFFSASVFGLTPVCVSSISPAREFGKRYAMVSLISGIAMFVVMAIAGVVVARSYKYFVVFVGLLSFFGTANLCVSRYLIVGKNFNKKI